MRVFIFVLALAVAANAALTPEQIAFQEFVSKYKKSYDGALNFFKRFTIFSENFNAIAAHNAKQDVSFTLAINQFADLTTAEFKQQFTRLNSFARKADRQPFELSNVVAAPESVDWRQKGVVLPVKNQGQCGSCWAFSAVSALESLNAIKNGNLVSLSEQQLVDCAGAYGNEGCNGGLMDTAFAYVRDKGICASADYPYTARDGTCKESRCTAAFKISGYGQIPEGDEKLQLQAIANSPVSVSVEAGTFAFQFYSGGVLDDPSCGKRLDHGITAVGYDMTAPKPYYIVRNSWGSSWGELGYVRIVFGKGMCGIADDSSFPLA